MAGSPGARLGCSRDAVPERPRQPCPVSVPRPSKASEAAGFRAAHRVERSRKRCYDVTLIKKYRGLTLSMVSDGMSDEPGDVREVGGVVKWFNIVKGFGFVTPSDGSSDAFLHLSVLRDA